MTRFPIQMNPKATLWNFEIKSGIYLSLQICLKAKSGKIFALNVKSKEIVILNPLNGQIRQKIFILNAKCEDIFNYNPS